MLFEISSDKFKNGAIRFNSGLNVVLGDSNATNSIGKSTLLSLIDLAFGGQDFFKLHADAISALGHHEYRFTFLFDDNYFYFRRRTDQARLVDVCNEQFELTRSWSVEDYRSFLKAQYHIRLPDLTFRALLGPYTRIWGKENLSVSRPLNTMHVQKGEDAVDNLLKTYDRFENIRLVTQELELADKKLRTWKDAAKQKLVPKIDGRTFKENQARLTELEGELTNIRNELAQYATNLSAIVNKKVLSLKVEKDRLLELKFSVESRLQRIQLNLKNARSIKSKSFKDLVAFVPAIDADRLANVEEFHNGVARLLRAELTESELALQQELDQIISGIENIDGQMAVTLGSVEQPSIIVDRVYEVASQMKQAQAANDSYEGGKALKDEVDELEDQRDIEKENICSVVQSLVNQGMRKLVTDQFGEDRKAPQLTLWSEGYKFETYDDTGTGVAYTGVVIFDLTIFNSTELPILIHDSVLYKNIANDAVARLIPVYAHITKQSFIALDEIQKYGIEVEGVLQGRAVVRLSNENVLYTADWRPSKE